MTLIDYANIATISSVAVAAGALLVAWRQLSGVRTELRMNSLMAVLEIEAEMNSRKEKVDSIAFKVRTLATEGKLSDDLKDVLTDERGCALENWLNSVDRLAYCILKNYLKDRDWRSEYCDYIQNIVRDNEFLFGAGSRYTNIIDINDRWKRE
jgi:hypothetical protein